MQAIFNMVGKVFASAIVYVIAYILLMLPTYYLPYVGSNSALLAGLGAVTGVGLTPQFWMHVACLYSLVVITWLRGCQIGKLWITIFPVVASVFDMVPGVNLIPLVPTAMHVCALVLGSRGGAADSSPATVPVIGGLFALVGGLSVGAGMVGSLTWHERIPQTVDNAAAKGGTTLVAPNETTNPGPATGSAEETAAKTAQDKSVAKIDMQGDWYGMGVRMRVVAGDSPDSLKAHAWLAGGDEPPTFFDLYPRYVGETRQYADKTNCFVIEAKGSEFVDAQFTTEGAGYVERLWRFQNPMDVHPLPGVEVPTGVTAVKKNQAECLD